MRIRTDYWARLTDHGHDWSAVDADHYAGTGTSPIGCGASKVERRCNRTDDLGP
jgi:hypothetical protein